MTPLKPKELLFKCLQHISNQGNSANAISAVWTEVTNHEQFKERLDISYNNILTTIKCSHELDARLRLGCLAVTLIDHLLTQITEDFSLQENNEKLPTQHPPSPDCLLSVKEYKVLEEVSRQVMFWPVLGCLEGEEAALYLKVILAKLKWPLAGPFISVPVDSRNDLLTVIMISMIKVFKNKVLGLSLRRSLSGEMISVLLHLSFNSELMKHQPDQVKIFQGHLEDVMKESMERSSFIEQILLIMGVMPHSGRLWRVCESLIVQRYLLVPPTGVKDVLLAGLTIGDAQNWKYCEALAGLIALRRTKDLRQFYSVAGQQIIDLLLDYKSLSPDALRVVAMVILKLTERSSSLTAEFIMNIVLAPLTQLTDKCSTYEASLESSASTVTLLHKLLIEVCPPSSAFNKLAKHVLCPLLEVAMLPPTCSLKTSSIQIIVRYLSLEECKSTVDTLLCLVELENDEDIPAVKSNYTFSPCLENGFSIKQDILETPSDILQKAEKKCFVIVSILEKLQNAQLVLEFLKQVTIRLELLPSNVGEPRPSNLLLTESDLSERAAVALKKTTICVSILGEIAESKVLTDNLFQDLTAAVPVIQALIDASINRGNDPSYTTIQDSLLLNSIMLLLSYINHQTDLHGLTSSDWRALQILLPKLQKAENCTDNQAILMFIEQLKNTVLTHGVITKSPETSQDFKESPRTNNLKNDKEKNSSTNSSVSDCNSRLTYKQAMEDICSPHIPVKGHALIQLSKMIENGDVIALENKYKLLSIFEHHMKDEDSYLYLASIQGLVVLCNAYPDHIFPLIIKALKDGSRSAKDRVKLTEIITRTTKNLGELLPQHRNMLLHGLLSTAEDSDGLIRAASVSALGELYNGLGWSIQSILHQTLSFLYNTLLCDDNPEVRRAVVMSLVLLLRGQDINAIKILQDVLRDIYRVLKRLASMDPDDIVQLHAQLALEEIDNIMRQFLQPKLEMKKNIYITDMPPSYL